MTNKQFEKAVLSAFYSALDSQGVEIPELPTVEELPGGHIHVRDSATGSTISVIYVVKPVNKTNDRDRRNDLGSVQRGAEQGEKRT